MPNPPKSLLNRRFGKLTVLAHAGKNAYHDSLWLCLCDCGGVKEKVLYGSLVNGRTRSCGCAKKARQTEEDFC